ncbi:hypothetical protein [Selenomonas ruminantium]|uniref:Uncharacterized protein n=1 Tax=Selenomonas ruminantium TaxID=971 RepID=A0A1K1LWW2_SELRU|nr:hypothetical protein [Selenomonas ruminantium]SFW14166.1 hypothetical protein SAMN02910323_0334 [Selenomonas ruminantium]
MSKFEPIYIESFVSDSLRPMLTEIFSRTSFIVTTSLYTDKFIWKISGRITSSGIEYIKKEASKYIIDELSNTNEYDLCSRELDSFIELLKYYHKIQEDNIKTKLDDMYKYRNEFYNHYYDENKNYIIYLDITQLLPRSNNKEDYFF